MIIVDPYSYHFYEDRLFGSSDLGDDGRCDPNKRVYEYFYEKKIEVHTSDFLREGKVPQGTSIDFYSLGMLNFRKYLQDSRVKMKAFVIHEPPVVAPRLYKILPELTKVFERVYIYNTVGDGYSLKNVDQSRLRPYTMPMPYQDIAPGLWHNRHRLKKIVMINSLQNPLVFKLIDMTSVEGGKKFHFNSLQEMFDSEFAGQELYSKRIESLIELSSFNAIDLFGRNWRKIISPRAMWSPYILNRSKILSLWKGPCPEKNEILSQYDFCLAIENMAMKGFVSEKLIDCFYSGTVPLYYGAPDIAEIIPQDCYIDCKKFSSWSEMWKEVQALPQQKIQKMRDAGRDFLKSSAGDRFYNSHLEVFGINNK